MPDYDILHKILDLARWAPSGDNTQPWRFEIIDHNHVAIHGHDTRDWCLYDFEGRASYMAHGALLETIRIAATGYGLKAVWVLRAETSATAPIYDVEFEPDSTLMRDPLYPFIEVRTVQRRPMRTTPLTANQRTAIQIAAGEDYTVQFFETLADRYEVAKLLWQNAHIRLTCPEAYVVHKQIIEWGVTVSQDRIPERAVGVDPLTACLMRWVMQSWDRLDFFNRYLFGTIAPRIQLDFLPAVFCAAHLTIKTVKVPETLIDFVSAGMVMQRVWLTCTANGLFLQPEMTPVIFNWYSSRKIKISRLDAVNQEVDKLAKKFHAFSGSRTEQNVFMCRIGISSHPSSRSARLSLSDLMWRLE
ncbi:molybdopterin biosynthesis protein MoeY [Nitrosomonas sp. HPC101]|uniref:nitroreductase family protein n=1 Tax=Nitrosomonas sp. HPC101 TaxID=1658667 RepID=UPI00136F0877|nr:nitroreductase family protein [Nitrosomonas sp. HPC101]MXS85045.1 molybdopterin biosynthesis protein MoeY [Nitrosomonas sp. HPC101]